MGKNCILRLIHLETWLHNARFGGCHVDDCEEYCHLVMSCEIWRFVMLMTVKNTVIFFVTDTGITHFLHTLNMLFIHIYTFGLFLRFCRLV